jgi:DNA adenine methylase
MFSCLKYYGGKTPLAKEIVKLMPVHIHYVEPYSGSLAVLFAKNPEGISEVVNDINLNLTTMWRVFQSPETFERFKRRLEATPFSEVEWRAAKQLCDWNKERGDVDSVDVAVAYFIMCRQSREGKCKAFATLSRNRTRKNVNEQASAWFSSIEGLDYVYHRLRNVVILCEDGVDVIKQQDGINTLYYIDPTYLHETRVSKNDYEYEMSPEQHKELLSMLCDIKGKFLLSGYHSDLYDEYAKQQGWHFKEFKVDCKVSKTRSDRIEVVWMNY